MKHLIPVRPVIAALAVFAFLFSVDLTGASGPEPFESMVLAEITRVEGDTLEGTVCGESAPGGEFVGSLLETLVGLGAGAVGTVNFEYAKGSLTVFFSDAVASDDHIEGAWHVLDGTGEFAGAMGGGELTGFFLPEPPDDGCGSENVIAAAVIEVTGYIVR